MGKESFLRVSAWRFFVWLDFLFQSSTRKSALLSAAKKAKLKSNPSRVRFAESVDINGSPAHNVSVHFDLFRENPD